MKMMRKREGSGMEVSATANEHVDGFKLTNKQWGIMLSNVKSRKPFVTKT